MIKIKIDVSKIDKSRLYKGNKGIYLDAVLIETPNGKYGDFMIVEEVSKSEREAGVKGTILGNGKNFGRSGGQGNGSNQGNSKSDDLPDLSGGVDDLPF